MKVVEPSSVVIEAADALASFRDDVVVVGAIAIEVMLAEREVVITPTRDVDVVVPTSGVDEVVRALEEADFKPSDVPHEAAFTWVRRDLKVQLVRSFHPFATGRARRLPQNPVFAMPADPAHRDEIAFADQPTQPRMWCANPLCLLALKQAAFGRRRPTEQTVVQRDYHDAYLLLRNLDDELVMNFSTAAYEVRARALDAIEQLAGGGDATLAAADQMLAVGESDRRREAERAVTRAASRMRRRLQGR